jgi:hypothetical protein
VLWTAWNLDGHGFYRHVSGIIRRLVGYGVNPAAVFTVAFRPQVNGTVIIYFDVIVFIFRAFAFVAVIVLVGCNTHKGHLRRFIAVVFVNKIPPCLLVWQGPFFVKIICGG